MGHSFLKPHPGSAPPPPPLPLPAGPGIGFGAGSAPRAVFCFFSSSVFSGGRQGLASTLSAPFPRLPPCSALARWPAVGRGPEVGVTEGATQGRPWRTSTAAGSSVGPRAQGREAQEQGCRAKARRTRQAPWGPGSSQKPHSPMQKPRDPREGCRLPTASCSTLEAPGAPGTSGTLESPPSAWQAPVFWQFLTPRLSSTSCSVPLWMGAPPLSLHHPRQQLSKPGRVGRERPAGSVPSVVRWLPLLSRTMHPRTPLSVGAEPRQLWGRAWAAHHRGVSLGSHRRLRGCVPPSPRPEAPDVGRS